MSLHNLDARYKKLKEGLRGLGSVLVAYSGGVDSTLLLKIASDVLAGNVLAVTALSETYPASEIESARRFAEGLNIRHKIIRTEELKNLNFKRNPSNRCYYCKKELFSVLKKIAKKNNLNCVIDGSNVDDLKDYRPGTKAKDEFGVISPLQDAGFTKYDVRCLSKSIGLATWCKPALACLASRIPYNSRISKKRLMRIDNAEDILRKEFCIKGNIRVRDYGDKAQVEVDKKEMNRLLCDKKVEHILKPLGYKQVVIDPKGYRTGSMNEGYLAKV